MFICEFLIVVVFWGGFRFVDVLKLLHVVSIHTFTQTTVHPQSPHVLKYRDTHLM